MQLFKLPPPPQDLVCDPEQSALVIRDSLLDLAGTIQAVTTAEDNQKCALVGADMQKLVKGVESTRKDLTAPYLAAQRVIKATSDAFCEPLMKALDRLGRLAAVYRTEQERLADAARRQRAAALSQLQEQERQAAEKTRLAAEAGDLAGAIMGDLITSAAAAATTAAIAVPEIKVTKTEGQSFRPGKLCFEVTDINALWAARSDLCNAPTAKASAINAVCYAAQKIPGLRLWTEDKVNFNARR